MLRAQWRPASITKAAKTCRRHVARGHDEPIPCELDVQHLKSCCLEYVPSNTRIPMAPDQDPGNGTVRYVLGVREKGRALLVEKPLRG